MGVRRRVALLAVLGGGSAGCASPRAAVEPEATARLEQAGADAGDAAGAEDAAADGVVEVAAPSGWPRTVVEAQPERRAQRQELRLGDGSRAVVTLTDLAPRIGVWWTLEVARLDAPSQVWHLEVLDGPARTLRLDPAYADGLVVDDAAGASFRCALWERRPSALDAALSAGAPYPSLCGGRLALRVPTVGHRTTLEWAADMLRDHVVGGEAVTEAVKRTVFADSARVSGEVGAVSAAPAAGGPSPAQVDPASRGRVIRAPGLGLPLEGAGLGVGAWMPVRGAPGVWASAMLPGAVDPGVIAHNGARVAPLDAGERSALVYSAAFDLSAFEIGYELGTDHPRVGWSERVPAGVRDPSRAGPDGYGTLAPLVRTGLLNPALLPREVAVFVAGFKRAHGAFAYGDLARRNDGSHYGFVQQGVVLSRLQPGLATFVVWADRTVELRTWTEADAARIDAVRFARQNGVALVEPDGTGGVIAGDRVRDWGGGNWSGSASGEQRSLRSAACVQDGPAGRFLLYSYFSSATPSGMADVLAAYGCRYAMLLDMNALEHTYLALHLPGPSGMTVAHLVDGMDVLDQHVGGTTYARFVGYADNRDFFYVLRRG